MQWTTKEMKMLLQVLEGWIFQG